MTNTFKPFKSFKTFKLFSEVRIPPVPIPSEDDSNGLNGAKRLNDLNESEGNRR